MRDVETHDWIGANNAVFVLEDDQDEQQQGEPMGVNPRPFADPEAAQLYVDDRPWLDSEAIVTYEDLDYETALQYNGSRIPLPESS